MNLSSAGRIKIVKSFRRATTRSRIDTVVTACPFNGTVVNTLLQLTNRIDVVTASYIFFVVTAEIGGLPYYVYDYD